MKYSTILLAFLASFGAYAKGTPAAAVYFVVKQVAGCPIVNVEIKNIDDRTQWIVTYSPTCTQSQIAAGNAAVNAFDLAAWKKVQGN